MAYVLSQKLLDRIYQDLDRGETASQATRPTPTASQHSVPLAADGTSRGWFVLKESLTLSGFSEMAACKLTPCPDGAPYSTGFLVEPSFSGSSVTVYDLLWRCTTEVPQASIVYCEKINGVWAFVRAVNTPRYAEAPWTPTAPSPAPTGDPTAQFVGKTTAAWAKGTTHDVEVHYQSGSSWYPLTATQPGDVVTTTVVVNCYNRYADIGSDKWVRVTGGGELVSAEC